MAIDWSTETFAAPNPFTWEAGWLNWPTWIQTQAPEAPWLPTVVPPSVATAEVCFRLPDGWSVCVPPGIWEQDYRNRGYPEILGSAPEFVPASPPGGPWTGPEIVVPTDASASIPEEQGTVAFHGEGSYIDWGIGVVSDWINPATTPIYNFAGPAAPTGPATLQPGVGQATCGKSPCVCGVDSCGRPALIDPRTGKRCYRRRRRRLLTEGDFNDLMRIATLPNKQNVTVALAKAIGRR